MPDAPHWPAPIRLNLQFDSAMRAARQSTGKCRFTH
jgi:hypothetical protein